MNATVNFGVVFFLRREEIHRFKVDKLYYSSKQKQISIRVMYQLIKTKIEN